MSVTIDNKVADPILREEINLQVQQVFEAAPQGWHVSIVPAADNDDWQLHVYSPKKREFSTLLIGTDGQHTPVFIRDYIERALQQSEKHVSAGASATTTSVILEKSSSTAKDYILGQFKILSGNSGGIESWLTHDTDEQVFTRLSRIASEPLSKVQLNQLLLLGHEAGVSDGFFRYYWLTAPPHVYDLTFWQAFEPNRNGTCIQSLEHLPLGSLPSLC